MKIGEVLFLVNNFSERLIRDAGPAGWDIKEPGIREAVEQHTAWLSVEILEPEPSSPEDYRVPARLLASLINEDCLVLRHPPLNRFVLYSRDTARALRSDFPIREVFGE